MAVPFLFLGVGIGKNSMIIVYLAVPVGRNNKKYHKYNNERKINRNNDKKSLHIHNWLIEIEIFFVYPLKKKCQSDRVKIKRFELALI